jgi:hypothetical protein
MVRGLNFIGIFYLAGKFGGGVDQGGETLGADIHLLAQILQGYQGNFLFGLLAVQACFHWFFNPRSKIINRKSKRFLYTFRRQLPA